MLGVNILIELDIDELDIDRIMKDMNITSTHTHIYAHKHDQISFV